MARNNKKRKEINEYEFNSDIAVQLLYKDKILSNHLLKG